MQVTWRGDAATLDRFRARAVTEPLSYPEVGHSLAELPEGYHRGRDAITVGHGDAAFASASNGLCVWACHRAAGIRVAPHDAPIAIDTTVALAISIVRLRILAACRIVRVVDEADRFGFAYGTLRSHPEVGEEAFVVDRRADGTITFTISVFWRPAGLVARLGGPVTELVQRRAAGRYLDGLAQHVHRELR